jgi:hypothetical protein
MPSDNENCLLIGMAHQAKGRHPLGLYFFAVKTSLSVKKTQVKGKVLRLLILLLLGTNTFSHLICVET